MKLQQARDNTDVGSRRLMATGHTETLLFRKYCASSLELWEREFMQLHHIDLWELQERCGGWKLSGLEGLQNKIPGETQVNRFTPQKHDGSKTIVWSENHGPKGPPNKIMMFKI